MTVGTPWKLITAFALPTLLSQIFQQLYNTADSLIVGRFLGDEALAAVSSSGTLIFLLISFFMGTAMGASVTISRYFGAGDHERVSRAIHTNLCNKMQNHILTGNPFSWLAGQYHLNCGRHLKPCFSGCHTCSHVRTADTCRKCTECTVCTGVRICADNKVTRADNTLLR